MNALRCWNCGAGLEHISLPIGRRADCPECRAELHSCRMCREFDPKRPDQCREDRAEPPTNKDVANFCEWFSARSGLTGIQRSEDTARRDLDALFGGEGEATETPAQDPDIVGDASPGDDADAQAPTAPDDPAAAARRALDDLFD